MRYDNIIVGAGSSGAVLAARLTENPGRHVLLLEAGPDYPTLEQTPPELLNALRVPGSHDWGFTAEVVPGRRASYLRGKATGGSSAVNAVLALRGMPADYDEWAAWGNPEWGWSSVLPYFRRLEDDQDVRSEIHGAGGPIPIRRWQDTELLPAQRAFVAACRELGFPIVSDHNDPYQTGIGPMPLNVRNGVRMSTAIGYLLPARSRSNLHIRGQCLVDRVLFNGRRAIGVELECEGVREQVFGDRITLSAGAIGSPAILLRSGVGPAGDLRWLGIEPVVDLPGVGANLIDHAGVGISLTPNTPPGDDNPPFVQTLLRYTAPGSVELNDMQILPSNGVPPSTWIFTHVMRPRSRGMLRLVHRDPHHQPAIHLHLASDREDRRRLTEGLRLVLQLAASSELAACHSPGVLLEPDSRLVSLDDALSRFDSPEGCEAYIDQTVGDYVHPVGTARMGPNGDVGAVVDQRCQVRGFDNLRVVDASVMPNVPRANTNLTCIMIGERIADWMRED
jgi:choline dehydrogenase